MRISDKLQGRYLTDALITEQQILEEAVIAVVKLQDITWSDGPRAMEKRSKAFENVAQIVNKWNGKNGK